ncbi:MAG: TasA family protein [Dehalococcoidia bacterium]
MRASLGLDRDFGSIFSGRSGRLVMIALLAGALITSVLVGSTGAFFTDAQNVGSNVFGTGTLDISTSPASAIVSFSAMAPGDTVTAPVTVTNAGTMQMRYAIRSTTTEDLLAAQLDLTIKTGVTTCNNGGFGVDGTALYGAGDAGNTGGLNLVGDPSQGAQAGDRTLGAANNEILCIQVSLPSSTGNSYQGLTTTATLEFLAEQTANNS